MADARRAEERPSRPSPPLSPSWITASPGAVAMKRPVVLLALAALLGGLAPLFAAEPHLEFIQGLRDRQYPDLAQARAQADMDLALTLFDQAQTYIEEEKEDVIRKRSELIKQAVPLLEKVAAREGANPLRWRAQAWKGRCSYEGGEPDRARK